MDSTLGSASQSSVTAIEQNDSSSSPQIDKADTDLSFHSTRNEGEIGEPTTFIPTLHHSPPFPSTLFSEVSSEQTYGTRVSVDELDGNKAQLAYPPSDGTDTSHLPPLVPVRRHSQSHLNGRTQSATTSPPIAQYTSIKVSHVPTPANSAAPQGHQLPSQESYRVPIAQTPQTQTSRTSGNTPALSPRRSGESWNSERSSSLTPRQYTNPLQQNAPNTPSMDSGIPSQPYRPSQSAETPQLHSSGPTQPSIPQSVPPHSYIIPNISAPQASRSVYEGIHQPSFPESAPTQSYRLPGAPTPQGQSMYAGVSQPFISDSFGLPFGHVPSHKPLQAGPYSHPIAYNSIGNPIVQTLAPQTFKKANAFVASDPFRVTHRDEKVDAPSDGLTFDDIPTAGRPPGPVPTRPVPTRPVPTRPSRSYSLPSVPTQSRYTGTAPQSYSLPGSLTQPQTSQPIYTGTLPQFIPPPPPSQFYNIPNTSTPQVQSIHSGTPPQSYGLPNRPTPGTPPQSYSLPNRPAPQASQPIYTGTPQHFGPQPTPSQFYSIPNPPAPQSQPIHIPGSLPGASYIRPTPPYFTGYNPTPQVIKRPSFVANDPFQVTYGSAVVDAPSNFDDISAARSSPEPGMVSYGAPPRQPTYGGYYYPSTARPYAGAYGQGRILTQPGDYPTFKEDEDEGPWYQPETHHYRYNSPYANAPLPDAQFSTHPGAYSAFNDERAWYQPDSHRHRRSSSANHDAYVNVPLPDAQFSTHPGAHSAFNDERAWYQPDSHRRRRSSSFGAYANPPSPDSPQIIVMHSDDRRHRRHRHHRQRTPSPPPQEGTGSAQPSWYLPSIPHTQPKPPTVFSPPEQSEAQKRRKEWYQPDSHRHRRSSSANAYTNAPLPDSPPIIVMHGNDRHDRQQTPPTPQEDTDLAQPHWHLPSIPYTQPKPPTVFSPPEHSEAQKRREEEQKEEERRKEEIRRQEEGVPSAVSSIRHSPIIVPNADDTATPPAVPANRPSSPSRSHRRARRSSSGSSSYLPYPPYPPYLPYLQQPQYQYAKLPKKSFFSRFFRSSDHTHPPANPQPFTALYPQPFTEPYTMIYPPMDPEIDWQVAIVDFFLVGFPKQMYLLLLLRLPSLYFSRVARIFEDADMSLPEIKKMALETASQGLTREFEIEMAFESSSVPPAYKRLTSTWEYFIDSVMREWKTFNIISVLLLTAILTILQIGSAADDPLTRYTALFSLMCALISLLFGCMYIIRFGTMRKSYKAAEWALEAKKSKTLIWWNVWILLAMPAIWLTWSIILYLACIMSFIWRTGVTSTTPPGLSDTGLLVIRIVMTVVLGLGMLYGLLIMTTFQRYGMVMDKAWKQRIDEWIREKAGGNLDSYAYPTMEDETYPPRHRRSSSYHRPTPSRYYQPSFGSRYPQNTVYVPPSSRSSTPSPKPYEYYTPAYAPPTIIQLPPGSPHSSHSSKSDDASRINRPGPNQPAPQPDSRVPQPSLGGMTSATNPGATYPTPNPRGSAATAEEFPPRLIPERTLYPITEASVTSPSEDGDNALGFSSGLENRNGGGDDDAPDDGNRVRFRLPSGSSDISDDWQRFIPSRKTHHRKTPKR